MRQVLASIVTLGLSSFALAGPVSYAGKTIPINCGVLIIESQRTANGEAMNPTPFVWAQMDADMALKPAGWSLQNPRAQTVLSQTLYNRWSLLNAANGGGILPNVGSRLTKRDAPYWEVDLNEASDQVLSNYDALLLTVEGTLSLSTIERERLRRFVDGGGLLWVDMQPAGPNIDIYNPTPLPFDFIAGGGTLYADPNSSLLSTPNRVSISELGSLMTGVSGSVAPISSVVQPVTQSWLIPDSLRFTPVVGESGSSLTVGLGRIGEGYMLVTTRGIAQQLNGALDNSGNFIPNRTFRSGFLARTRTFTAAEKLIFNALYLSSSYETENRGPHKTNSNANEITAPVSNRFTYPTAPSNSTTPALSDGLMIMTENGRIVAVDTKPNFDRDGDGNPDDGLVDPSGSPFDIVWATPLPGTSLSAPTVAEIPRTVAVFGSQKVVLIQGIEGNGVLYEINMADGALLQTWQAPVEATQAPAGASAAPVVHEGMVFVADTRVSGNTGRIWIVDLANQVIMSSPSGRWAVQGAPRLGPVAGAPTVGYIPILDNSGGVDKVLYVPTQGGFGRSAGLVSMWFSARGESPAGVIDNGNGTLTLTTRAAQQNLPLYLPGVGGNQSLGVKLSARQLDPLTGADLGPIDPAVAFTGTVVPGGQNGVVTVGVNNSFVWTGAGQTASIRIDYTINWGAQTTGIGATSPESFIRGDLQLPDDPTNTYSTIGGISMSQNGNLFVVVGPAVGADGGTIYCVREYGRGDFRVLYRWEAYDAITYSSQTVSGSINIPYDPAIVDNDGLLDFAFLRPIIDFPLRHLRVAGGPSVRGNRCYVALTSSKAIPFLPPGFTQRFIGTILALDADPQPLEIEVEGLTSPNFAILQPDPTRSTDKVKPNVLTVLQPNQYTFERNGSSGLIRLQSSAPISRGRIRDCVIANLPIIIRRAGQPDIVIEPELGSNQPNPGGVMVAGNARGRWNPQKWQMVFNGLDATSAPFLSGDMLYIGGGSFLPRLFDSIAGGSFPPDFSGTDGLIYAVNTRIAGSDLISPNVKRGWQSAVATARYWQPSVSTINQGATGEFLPSKYLLMPQAYGVESFDDYRVRLRQAVLNDPNVQGMCGGEGVLAVWGNTQTYLMARGNFVIADENRVLRVDSVGNPIWASDSTNLAGSYEPVGTSARSLGLGRPSRVYQTSDNGFLIADPNNNRVMEVDAAGNEVRTISRMKIDPRYLPDGTPDNTVLTLSQPRDVSMWTSFVSAANNRFSNPQPDEYWVHHLIADTGNSRVIELVDRYVFDRPRGVIGSIVTYNDPNSTAPGATERALGVLNWHIKSELAKKRYAFNSIDRAYFTDALGTRAIYAFGFGNIEPSASTFGLDSPGNPSLDNHAGAGGIVLYDPVRGAYKVIGEFNVPAIGPNAFWNTGTLSFNSPAVTAQPGRHIMGLKSVTVRFINNGGTPQLAVMFTDNTGAYEVVEVGAGVWATRWAMPREAFTAIRFTRTLAGTFPSAKNAADFQPTFARRLDSGEVLLVNGYVGKHRPDGVPTGGIAPGDPYTGEVDVLDGTIDPTVGSLGFDWNKPNLGFNNYSVKFELPPIQGTRGLVAPVFADKR